MDRPKEAIERMRLSMGADTPDCECTVLEYLDWLEGKHVVEWPSELTRERLMLLSDATRVTADDRDSALRTLASIAPQRKKRMVNIWETGVGNLLAIPVEQTPNINHWRKVAGPIEI